VTLLTDDMRDTSILMSWVAVVAVVAVAVDLPVPSAAAPAADRLQPFRAR
jgi:hypothetical protein